MPFSHLPSLEKQMGGGDFYADPVQQNLPEPFKHWLKGNFSG